MPKEAGLNRFCGDLVDGAEPPGHHEAEQQAEHGAGEADEPELHQEPAQAADALGPGQAEGPCLELAGHERCSPEHPDEHGDDEHESEHQHLELAVVGRHWVDAAAGAAAAGPALGQGAVVDVDEIGPGDEEDDAEDDQPGSADDRLRAELAPREGDHESTSSARRAPRTLLACPM